MTWCPKCGETFRWYERECPTCGVELEDGPPRLEGEPDLELLSVLKTEDAGLLAVAQSLLEAEGIEYVLRRADDDGLGARYGLIVERAFGPSQIIVRAEDADRARALLAPLEEAGPPPAVDEDPEPTEPK